VVRRVRRVKGEGWELRVNLSRSILVPEKRRRPPSHSCERRRIRRYGLERCELFFFHTPRGKVFTSLLLPQIIEQPFSFLCSRWCGQLIRTWKRRRRRRKKKKGSLQVWVWVRVRVTVRVRVRVRVL
jgi:hypothetical protein